ncbi:serine hydrolase domain-containing protein [Aureispira anguillae]|uniref:Beta-lactamase family protein n=1 Tax=Aureispira anguillae TaxID=2864201 RepID=A0A916DRD8_9BACT|nr:serine hydrolase [Aureispira anguillae]BDS10317.1 beta-lactamase family protein [Aureispira anguillae]
MIKFLLQALICGTMLSTLSSCTLTKIVVFFKPGINDHKKIFVCDTIPGASTENWATSSLENSPYSKPLFTNVHNPANIPALKQWIPKSEKVTTSDLDDFLETSKTTALIVIKNDSILYERYLNGGSKQEPKIVFSVTKAMTATLTAIAAEEGLLSLDQKVAEFIPEFGKDARKDISLRHLMGMVSGLKWHDFDNVLRLGGLYYTPNQQRFVKRAAKQKHEPTTHFAYKSLSTQILGICLEKAIGQSLASYLEAKIWKPVGMQYDAMVTLDSKKHRNARTFGGMALTAADMARFGKLMLNDGLWEGQQIVPKWFVKELKNRDLSRWFGYSNCYWRNGYEEVGFANNQQYWAAGYHGQYIFVSPKDNIILIRTGSSEKHHWSILLGRLAAMLGAGRTDLTDKTLDFGAQFEGTYQNQNGKKMHLELLPQLDEYGRREWLWKRDLTVFEEGKKLEKLVQLDGISLGYKKGGVQTRMYYVVKDDQVVGFYYNSWPAAGLDYFEKVH